MTIKIRLTAFSLAVMIMLSCFCTTAFADYTEDIGTQLGTAQDTLSDDAKQALEESGATSANGDISLGYIFRYVIDSFLSQLRTPIELVGRLLGILLICSMFSQLTDGTGGLSGVLSTVGSLASVGVLYTQVSSALTLVCDMLSELNAFMIAYIPVFVSLLASGGCVSSASGYYIVLMGMCEVISLFAEKMLVPLCSVMLAISIAEGISPLSNGGISSSLKKGIQWSLGVSATVFVGVLSIRSIVASAADTVAVRAAKFTASSFVPIIGSAVSEAYATVSGSIALIRSAAGAFGVMSVLFVAIRPIAAVLVVQGALKLTKALADMLGQKSISGLISGVGDVFSIILTIAVLMSVIFIIATALMMLTCMS